MQGWIKLHRKLKSKAFYAKDSEKVHLWIHLLMCANHTGREEFFAGKPIYCNSGTFTTGRKQLSMETGISESKIQRILTYFEKIEQQIEQQTSSVNRLISIKNWHDYQQLEQQTEQQVNNDRTTSEQRVNTPKECKELNNDNNVNKINREKYSSEIINFTQSLIKYFDSDIVNNLKDGEKWKWVDCIHKLYTLDKFELPEIEKAVKNARDNEFWKKNFMSLLKLRKKDKDGIRYIHRFLKLKENKNDITANNGYIPNW